MTNTASSMQIARTNAAGTASSALTLASAATLPQNQLVPARTSTLPAPIMLLTGHQAEVSSLAFNTEGDLLASSSYDRDIYLWRVGSECENSIILKGHRNAALCVAWSPDSRHLYSCSADKTVIAWDVETGQLVQRFKGHRMCVTNVAVPAHRTAGDIVVSGGDCGDVKFWDPRANAQAHCFATQMPVTALQVSHDGNTAYAASVDNVARAYDVRAGGRLRPQFTLVGHVGTIVGMRLSPDGSTLLTNSVDNTLRAFSVLAHSSILKNINNNNNNNSSNSNNNNNNSLRTAERIFEGAPHDFSSNMVRPAWSTRGNFVACGSADRTVVVWEYLSGRMLYKLPGHRGGVTDVAWHPRAPVLASSSVDKSIYIGELSRDLVSE